MMKIKKIAVFTGNRAEYGLQYPVLKAIEKHPNLDYQLMVSGAHLDDNFGNTKNEIINDGFKISSEINIHLDETKKFATPQAIGSGVIEISSTDDAFAALKSDGSVVTWGSSSYGGDSSSVSTALGSGVIKIFSTQRAFAALKSDGSWLHGGTINTEEIVLM